MLISDYLSFEHERVWPVCELRSRADGQEEELLDGIAAVLLRLFCTSFYSSYSVIPSFSLQPAVVGNKMEDFFFTPRSLAAQQVKETTPRPGPLSTTLGHPLCFFSILLPFASCVEMFFSSSASGNAGQPGWLRCHPTCCLGWRTQAPSHPTLWRPGRQDRRGALFFLTPLNFFQDDITKK